MQTTREEAEGEGVHHVTGKHSNREDRDRDKKHWILDTFSLSSARLMQRLQTSSREAANPSFRHVLVALACHMQRLVALATGKKGSYPCLNWRKKAAYGGSIERAWGEEKSWFLGKRSPYAHASCSDALMQYD